MTLKLEGQIFGDLTVLYKQSYREQSSGRTLWRCKCLCGNEIDIATYRLTGPKGNKTCGKCEWHIKHKDAYMSWWSARSRCINPSNKDYSRYGGRGITFSEEWKKFTTFLADMGDPPIEPISRERYSLDRKDNNLGYSKDNCRWATRSEQQLNKPSYRVA